MAESVDALVSNTSGATRPGSTPGLGTKLKKQSSVKFYRGFFSFNTIYSDWVPMRYLPPQIPSPLLT